MMQWMAYGYAYNEERLIEETAEIEGGRINPETDDGFMLRGKAIVHKGGGSV